MSFAKTLFAGAAICALCTVPALARPSIHLAGSGFDSPAKLVHLKTNGVRPNATNVTETFSFSATLSTATYRHVTVAFNEYTWETPACIPPQHEKFTVSTKKTAAAKLSVGSSTGSTTECPSAIFTFYGPNYELTAKNATSDFFTGALVAKKYSGYNLTLNENWNINITP